MRKPSTSPSPSPAPAPSPPKQIDNLLTCRQAAAWLQISIWTVRGWILQGRLEAFNVGTDRAPRYLIPAETVLERFRKVRPVVM